MKRKFLLICIITILIIPDVVFGAKGSKNIEKKFGMPISYRTNSDYPGSICVDGLYVYSDGSDYIFTILYSKGKLVQVDGKGKKKVRTSFFNPPDGDILKVFWGNNSDSISSKNKIIQYKVDAEKLRLCDKITVLFYDTLYYNDDENMGCYFEVKDINFDGIPEFGLNKHLKKI